MAGIIGVILDSFQNHKIFVFFPFQMFLPIAVTVIGIMIGDEHTVVAFFLQDADVLLHPDLTVHRPFMGMAMHI